MALWGLAWFRRHTVIWQIILYWAIWLLLSFSLLPRYESALSLVLRGIPLLIILLILIPLNTFVLLPSFYFRKKYFLYCSIGIVIIVSAVILFYSDLWPWPDWVDSLEGHRRPPQNRPAAAGSPPFFGLRRLRKITPVFIVFLANTLFELAKYANQKERIALVLEKEKISTDLLFLKSQINPHFLFNAMNNLYSLATIQSPHTAENIMQLSEILRYMVYDSNESVVPLKSEIQYIKNFVNLMLLKDSRGMNVKLDFAEADKDLMIAPLLFIPFVENAFKHSHIEDLNDGYIDIKLSIDEASIHFTVVNSIPNLSYTKDHFGGVGLTNVQRRLGLLYPDGLHTLLINQNDTQFAVSLRILL